MAKARLKVERFDRINRNNLRVKDRNLRTRTGAYKSPNRVKAHRSK
jgi:hypothetical protein